MSVDGEKDETRRLLFDDSSGVITNAQNAFGFSYVGCEIPNRMQSNEKSGREQERKRIRNKEEFSMKETRHQASMALSTNRRRS